MLTFRNMATIGLPTVLLLATPGCNRQSAVEEVGMGELVGKTYKHKYFDLKIRFPNQWHVLSQSQMKSVRKAGRKIVAGNNIHLHGDLKRSSKRTIFMASASRYSLKSRSRGRLNPNINVGAERVKSRRLKTGEDYLLASRKLLKRSHMKVSFDRIVKNQKVGRFTTDCQHISIKFGKRTIRQRHYAVRVKDYYLVFVLTFESGSQLQELLRILKTVA